MNNQMQSIQNLTPYIQSLVSQTIKDVLEDPDFGLELSLKAQKRIAHARKAMTRKEKNIPLSEIKKKYGLK